MNTVTEEATNMGVNTETIGGEAPLGLLNHVVGFRSQAVAKVIQNHENTKKLEDGFRYWVVLCQCWMSHSVLRLVSISSSPSWDALKYF